MVSFENKNLVVKDSYRNEEQQPPVPMMVQNQQHHHFGLQYQPEIHQFF
jgi:hypothetical protein